MYGRNVKIALAALSAAILAATGIFYSNSTVRGEIPQSASTPIKKGEKRILEGIEGRVIDVEGQPIAGAKVFAERDNAQSTLVVSSITNKEGDFRIDVREPGTYLVYGSKERDGYPLTLSGFHREGDAHNPTVTVAQGETVRGVVVKFGPKAAKIEGIIADAVTNQPVSKATITLRRLDNPEVYYIIGAAETKEKGRFKVLVPSVPFTIEVSSPGYETWTYGKNNLNDRSDPLTVSRGEVKKLRVALRQKKHPSNRGE